MVFSRSGIRAACLLAILASSATESSAQSEPVGEELEPRVVGATGVTTMGLSGFIDKVSSSEDAFPWRATGHLELTRFVTAHFAARLGVLGSSTADGLDDDERIGAAAPAFHATVAALAYFTPGAVISPYVGMEYRARLTERPEKDAGTVLAIGGVQAALSSRASVFVESGYGIDLTRGSDDELRTRFTTSFGVRIRF
jgi:hypothetical protein